MEYILEFEKPLLELENKIAELLNSSTAMDMSEEIEALKKKAESLKVEIYENLSPWELVQLARHPKRAHAKDFIENLITDFHEVHGDRKYFDDESVICGFGYFKDQKVCVIGIEKGRKTAEKIKRNFGMMNPEGYRKALRVMKLAEKFNIPVITFIDTPGAYPGLGAEERGQSEAIADNLVEMIGLKTPIISLVIGEGGSGGALGIGVADKVLMLNYSVYSVISPESCASILWSDPSMASKAANALELTAKKAKELGVIDEIIPEPLGGMHLDAQSCFESVSESLVLNLKELTSSSLDDVVDQRFQKFRTMGNQTLNWDEL